MMTIEELKRRKEELRFTAEMIAASSCVPLSTVQKIFSGATKNPRRSTIEAIERALYVEPEPASGRGELPAGQKAGPEERNRRDVGVHHRRYGYEYGGEDPLRDLAAEAPARYYYEKKDGYTVEDYYALPDDKRVELIDGVFYDMGAPRIIHQKILGELYILFRECMDRHEGECEVYLSPCDVRLDMDNRTMVQPDLLVVCRKYDITARAFEGAPDLTLEILSPSTRGKDMLLKLHKYAQAGVREYWIVDPDKPVVLVYDLEKEDYYPRKYGFEDTIPIGISGGECSIDFSRIYRRISAYYDGR